jgi:uncharacterized protein YbjT (DUF2867 family)
MSAFLVTGATGRHAGTGAYAARRLKEEGHPVRLLVRREDERSRRLVDEGFDVRVGDLRDRPTLQAALEGVTHASFCFPVDAGIVDAAASFSSALREAAPKARVVVLSMIPAHPKSPSPLGRAQWLAEEVMAWAGLDATVLRIAAMFYENVALLHGSSIRAEGVIRNCFGEARAPWIAGDDAGELVVAALLHPERFAGKAVHYPPGSALLSHGELAHQLSEETGESVRYEAIPLAQWREELVALASRTGTPINLDMANHISVLGDAVSQKGSQVQPDAAALERLTGRAPRSFRQYARSHLAQFKREVRA